MTRLDWLYSALLAILLVADHFIFTREVRRRSAEDPGKVFKLWFLFLGYMWLLSGAGVFLWIYERRPWGEIALSPPASGWRIWSSVALVLIVALLYGRDIRKAVRSAKTREKLRKQMSQLGTLSAMLPRTRSDFRLWVAVSLTAGIGEEFIFRGYLIWAFHHWLGWWVSAGLSLVAFAFAHSYQGPKGIMQTALVGALLTVVVAAFDSLIPAMALHTLIDIGSGYVAWIAFRSARASENAPVPAGRE